MVHFLSKGGKEIPCSPFKFNWKVKFVIVIPNMFIDGKVFIWPFLLLFSPLQRHNGKVMWGLPNLTSAGAKTYYLQDYFAKSTQFFCKSTWKLLCKGACTCHYAHFSKYLNIWIHLLVSPNASHAFAKWFIPNSKYI